MSELSNSSAIRACLLEPDEEIDSEVGLEVGSENEAESEGGDIGTDIEDFSEESLLDFSSGSGEEYSLNLKMSILIHPLQILNTQEKLGVMFMNQVLVGLGQCQVLLSLMIQMTPSYQSKCNSRFNNEFWLRPKLDKSLSTRRHV